MVGIAIIVFALMQQAAALDAGARGVAHRRRSCRRRRCSSQVVPPVAHGRHRLLPGGRPRRVHHGARDAAGLEPRVHAAQGARKRRASRGRTRKCSTPTPRSATARPARSTRATSTSALVAEERAQRQRRAVRERAARTRRSTWPARRSRCSRATSAADCKQIQLQLAGNDLAALDAGGGHGEGRSREDSGRGGHRALDEGTEAGARDRAQSRRRRHRWASRSGRSRSRCGRRSPASTPATGSIRRGEIARRRRCGSRRKSRQRASDLAQLPLVVHGPNGAPTTMPLGQVATITQGIGPGDHRSPESRARSSRSRLNTSGRAAGDVTADIRSALDEAAAAARRARTRSAATRESQDEVFGQIFSALGVAVLLMYLILVVQFGSFLDPVAILMSLPLSLIGVMLALAITGMTINIMTLDRRDPADGHRGEERDPAHRLREVGARGARACRCARR